MGAAVLAVGGAAYSAYSQQEGGKAQSSYYDYLARTARINSGLAESESLSERRQIGAQLSQEQLALTNRIKETVGAQKAAVVTGVGASSRSAQQIIGDTLDKGNLDELALRMNADIRSRNADLKAKTGMMNYESAAGGYGIAGGNAVSAGRMRATSSLIGGASSVYRSRGYDGYNGIE